MKPGCPRVFYTRNRLAFLKMLLLLCQSAAKNLHHFPLFCNAHKLLNLVSRFVNSTKSKNSIVLVHFENPRILDNDNGHVMDGVN
jgi:hypothetical protein